MADNANACKQKSSTRDCEIQVSPFTVGMQKLKLYMARKAVCLECSKSRHCSVCTHICYSRFVGILQCTCLLKYRPMPCLRTSGEVTGHHHAAVVKNTCFECNVLHSLQPFVYVWPLSPIYRIRSSARVQRYRELQ